MNGIMIDFDKTKMVSPKVRRILNYIDLYSYQPLNLKFCSSLVALHPDYFSKKFKREVGVPFREYILRNRLKRASLLLLGSPNQIKEIGAKVGFNSQEDFSRNFKRIVGCSPRKFRRKKQKKVESYFGVEKIDMKNGLGFPKERRNLSLSLSK